MLKRLISLISLCLIVAAIIPSCGGAVEETCSFTSDEKPLDTAGNPYYTVLADQNLQACHKTAILDALNDWATKTNFTLKYKLEFVDMSKQTKDTETKHTIKIYVADPGPGLAGWTSWQDSNSSAYTLVMPSIDENTFRLIMLHELGHAFNLHFGNDIHYKGPYQSVMYPGLGDAANEVSCPEITAFCKNYGCQVDCKNLAK
jgi:hypothetical protein